MWPRPGEALSHTVRCESALAELWGAALARWRPEVRAAVLPSAVLPRTLTAAADAPPPDPDAVAQTQHGWQLAAAVFIAGGVSALWCVAWWEAAADLGVTLPAIPADPSAVDPAVARMIAANTDWTAQQVSERVAAVMGDPALAVTAADFTLTATAEQIDTTPARFAVKLRAVLDGDGLPDDPAARTAVLATRAADALAPDSPLLRDYAHAQSLDAAAVQNHAVVHAARYADGPLDKTWICVHPDTVVSAVGVTHLARRRYKGALYSVRTASGAAVALTPQHRVLTGGGWIQAQYLNPDIDELWSTAATADDAGPGHAIGAVVDMQMSRQPDRVSMMRRGYYDGTVFEELDVEVWAAPAPPACLPLSINPGRGVEAVGDFAADRVLGSPGITRDRIVAVDRIDHDGYVYDLSTETHWYVANGLVISNCTIDGKTRATHFAADGQRVALDGKFTVGHSQMDHPGDRSAPPAEWKNCRCRVGVLAPDEAIPDEVDRHTERLDGRDSVAINRNGRSQAEEIERRAADGNIRAREDPEGIGIVAAAPTDTTMTTDRQEHDMTDGPELFRTFTDQAVAPIGVPTSDRRMLAADIDLRFRSFPLPLMWCRQSGNGHDDAFTVGVIESGRVKDGQVLVSGYLLNSPEADEAAEQNAHGVSQPSIDLADAEIILTDADGVELTEEQFWDAWENGTPVYETARSGELIGCTLVATPAFDTKISLNAEREARDVALVAAATITRRVYPAALFADPQLSGPTPMTMDPETGRIYGHLALWNTPHRSFGTERVTPPRSPSGYAQFHTSPPLLLDDGTRLPVGRLTVGTGHASLNLGGGPAMAHYDNTGTCFALVRMGEDRHGIWYSGVPAPWATPEQIEEGISSALSGDWRDFGRGRDLVAALAVNTPGFAVLCHTDDTGRPVALVASAGPALRRGRPGAAGGGLSRAAIKSAVAEALAEARTAEQLAALIDQSRQVVPDPPTPAEQIAAMFAQADAGV